MALVSGSVAHSLEEREDEDVKRQAMKVRQIIWCCTHSPLSFSEAMKAEPASCFIK